MCSAFPLCCDRAWALLRQSVGTIVRNSFLSLTCIRASLCLCSVAHPVTPMSRGTGFPQACYSLYGSSRWRPISFSILGTRPVRTDRVATVEACVEFSCRSTKLTHKTTFGGKLETQRAAAVASAAILVLGGTATTIRVLQGDIRHSLPVPPWLVTEPVSEQAPELPP